ncbi:hypothetical protein F5X99DRAFT_364320 [Biscogniauxia marginata]|nr:hypothetical protein F5X99DRAFT_364320 [Biscogniauxia marginata]
MFAWFYSFLVAYAAILPAVIAECDRTKLLAYADSYVEAHESGSVSYLENIADNFTYVENNQTREITGGIFFNAFRIDHRHTIVDTVDCATFTELIITHNISDAPAPHVIGTQLRHSPGDLSLYLMDIVVSGPGSWLFNASQTLYYAEREDWGAIDEAARDSRETLRLAADAYLDMWSNASAIDAVPWGTPCDRLEGSVYTGPGLETDSCKVGVPTNNNQEPNTHRRYVIDETYGAISVLCIFEHLDHAPDSHEFRLEGGKVRYIHTITLADSNTITPLGRRGGPSSRSKRSLGSL